jgi:four helix bundle protein
MIELGKGNVVVDRSFELALGVIDHSELLAKQGKTVVSKQILRSGTAVGALVAESQNAESKADFIHKMKIALKEANETYYWLTLCEKSTHLQGNDKLKDLCYEIIRIISKIIVSSKSSDQITQK